MDFDDGHIPEGVQIPTKLFRSEVATAAPQNCPPSVQVYDEALPASLCQSIYNVTAGREMPWGTYVTKEEALSVNATVEFPACGGRMHLNGECLDMDIIQDLATRAARHFIFSKNKNPCRQITGEPLNPMNNPHVHGVQIWALPAPTGSSVPYHIDYAEYIRYVHNIIVTPMYAGTVQCTPYEVDGGSFAVNLGGLGHYEEYGYKCVQKKLKRNSREKEDYDQMAGWNQNLVSTVCHDDLHGWVTIPYKFNQGILHTGSLPHLSGTVIKIEQGKRVIVGFNVFDRDIGPMVSRCPEHSDQFRKMVKLHRSCQGMKLDKIRQNKALTKLLVLAKRQKVKEQWRQMRTAMTQWLELQLAKSHFMIGKEGIQKIIKISDLLDKWPDEDCIVLDAIQPCVDDLHVHIHYLLKKKHFYAFDKFGCPRMNDYIGNGGLVDVDLYFGAKLGETLDETKSLL